MQNLHALLLVSSIKPDPNQPRKQFDEGELALLAENIKVHGVINPIEVTRDNIIVTGERRWRASQMAGLRHIPVKYAQPGKNTVARQLSENIVRENMNGMDIARAVVAELARTGESLEKLAKRVGMTASGLHIYVKAMEFDAELQAEVEKGDLTVHHLAYIRAMKRANPEAYEAFRTHLLTKGSLRGPDVLRRCTAWVGRGGDWKLALRVLESTADQAEAVIKLAQAEADGGTALRKSLTPGKRLAKAASEVALILSQVRAKKIRIHQGQLGRVAMSLSAATSELNMIGERSPEARKVIDAAFTPK